MQDGEVLTGCRVSAWVLGLALLWLQWEAWVHHSAFLVGNFPREMGEQGPVISTFDVSLGNKSDVSKLLLKCNWQESKTIMIFYKDRKY